MTIALFVLLIHSWKERSIEVTPLKRPEIGIFIFHRSNVIIHSGVVTTTLISGAVAIRFPAVDKHAVSLAQLICLPLIAKFSLARQNNKAKERYQILSLRYVWMNSLQRANLLQMEQRCPCKG